MPSLDDPALDRIARFWDARGREDPLRYSVPGGPPVDEFSFVASGEDLLDVLEDLVGFAPEGAPVAVDVGCGAGRVTDALARRADAVIACDIAPSMLSAARERHASLGNVTWHQAHAGALRPVADGTADAVLLLGLLPHLPTVDLIGHVLAELGRVLRSDATAVFDVRSGTPAPQLPGESSLPEYVSAHPLWRGTAVDLETLAAIAHQEQLILERIEGSGTTRCVVLARRE